MTSELLPCPFCGSEVEFIRRELFGSDYDHSNDIDNYDVACTDGDCYLSYGADWWLLKEEAVELWNRRKV